MNWRIRFYKGDRVVRQYVLENRTEHEAEREVAADYLRDVMEPDDWSMEVVAR